MDYNLQPNGLINGRTPVKQVGKNTKPQEELVNSPWGLSMNYVEKTAYSNNYGAVNKP